MRRNGIELHWDTPMPFKPVRQRHESPTSGDNIGAIMRSAGEFFDLNVTYSLGILWALHYAVPGKCGYLYVDKSGGARRKMNLTERRQSINDWGYARMLTLSRKNGERPMSLDYALKRCAAVGAVPIMECKSRAFGTMQHPWELIRDSCVRHDVPMWTKALASMWGIKGKVILAERAGVPLAVIYGKGVRGRVRRVAQSIRISAGWTVKPFRTW